MLIGQKSVLASNFPYSERPRANIFPDRPDRTRILRYIYSTIYKRQFFSPPPFPHGPIPHPTPMLQDLPHTFEAYCSQQSLVITSPKNFRSHILKICLLLHLWLAFYYIRG